MALPLPRVIADVGPGGPGVTAMGGMNSLSNNMILRQMNEIKKKYLPISTLAQAASQSAYANLMGPQYIAKMLQNSGILGNLPEDVKNQLLQMSTNAGMGQGGASNALNKMINEASQEITGGMNQNMGPGEKLGNSLSDFLTGKLRNIFGSQEQKPQQSQGIPQDNTQGMAQMPMSVNGSPPGGVMREGQQWYDKNGNPVYGEDTQSPMNLEPNQGQEGQRKKTYAENTGAYEGTVKQGQEEGKYRAQARNNISQSQLALSNSGASLNRMASIIKNPVIQDMRSKIPFFQDKQLSYLEKMGTPEQKKLIGDFIATGEQIIASGVQAFGGKPLVREFDLLQRQKINRNDPVHVAEGKLRSSIALHDIAEQKNEIINNLLGQGMNEADAIKQANKMVDISAIEKQTNELLRDKPTQEDIDHMAKKYNISSDEVKRRLKDRGLM